MMKISTPEPVVKVAKKPLIAMNFIVSDVDDEIEKLINGEDTRNIAQILMPYRLSDKNYLDCVQKIEPILAEFAELVEVRRLPKSQLTDFAGTVARVLFAFDNHEVCQGYC